MVPVVDSCIGEEGERDVSVDSSPIAIGLNRIAFVFFKAFPRRLGVRSPGTYRHDNEANKIIPFLLTQHTFTIIGRSQAIQVGIFTRPRRVLLVVITYRQQGTQRNSQKIKKRRKRQRYEPGHVWSLRDLKLVGFYS